MKKYHSEMNFNKRFEELGVSASRGLFRCSGIRKEPDAREDDQSDLSSSLLMSSSSTTVDLKNDPYFRSYGQMSIHQEMLKDNVRTMCFKDAICGNKHLFKNKIVMDVGCGTGILSLFAAEAGAALVIGIECSDILDATKEVVQKQEPEWKNRIVLIKGRLEDITELPEGIESVDIIVSEWMGYCLLFESMLDTVLYARDKWLKTDGLLFPDEVSLYIAGMEDTKIYQKRLDILHNVYGVDLSTVRKWVDQLAIVQFVNPSKVVTNDCLIKVYDLYKVKKEHVLLTSPIILTAYRDCAIHSLVTYFDVRFTKCHTEIGFSTSMDEAKTHWKQTLFYLKKEIGLKKNQELNGKFSMRQSTLNKRHLDFAIQFESPEVYKQFFVMH